MDEKNKKGTRVKRIVEMLRNSRRDQQISLEQLAEGVSTKSMLEKVEHGERTFSRNILNRLLSRLGIDQKKYEKYVFYTDYDEWKLKNDIINAIEDCKLERAKELVDEYDRNYAMVGALEKQFSIVMKIQILQHEKTLNEDEIYELYREAMLLTVPNAYKKETGMLMLSTDELNLILECRYREMYAGEPYEIFDIYQGFIKYIDNSHFDICAKAKIYPKVIVYMHKQLVDNMVDMESTRKMHMYKRLLDYCEKAIDILRDDCKSFYMCELFDTYMDTLMYLIQNSVDERDKNHYKESYEQVDRWNKAYIDVCKQYDISHMMLDCCYLYREEDVYCINDVIRKRRKMLGMSMTKLSEGICSQRTIRRLERRECKALEGIVDELFWRLGMSDEYANMGIVTDSKEDVELYEQCRHCLNSKEYDIAENIYVKLKNGLPDVIVNRQLLLQTKSLIEWNQGKIDIDEHVEQLKNAVEYTVKLNKIRRNQKDLFLSYTEIAGLHAIGIALKQVGQNAKAKLKVDILADYFSNIECNCEVDNVIGFYELVMCFYANLLGSMGKYEESNNVFSKLNKIMLKLRRTNIIHFNLYNIAWNDNECFSSKKFFKEKIKICIDLCQLTKNNYYETSYRKKLE